MSQTWKIIVAVIITAIIVGGGVYLWQTQMVSIRNQLNQNQTRFIEVSRSDWNTVQLDGISFQAPTGYFYNIRETSFTSFEAFTEDIEKNLIRELIQANNKDFTSSQVEAELNQYKGHYSFELKKVNGFDVLIHRRDFLGMIGDVYDVYVYLGNGKILYFSDELDHARLDRVLVSIKKENKTIEPEFRSLLYEKSGYGLPFGAAEIEGYYTTVERPTSLDESTPKMTCSAFVVTNGPSLLIKALTTDRFVGTPPTAVIGSKDLYLGNIKTSTKEKPIKIIVTLNPVFEGSLIECMPWPFSSIIEIENTSNNNTVILYQDNDYHIKFTTTKDCKDFYSVKTVTDKLKEAVRNYGVFVPGSKSWSKDFPWYYYSLYTQKTYDQFSPEELPGKPKIELRLDSGELLTSWSPQDGPTDVPNCGVKVEKF